MERHMLTSDLSAFLHSLPWELQFCRRLGIGGLSEVWHCKDLKRKEADVALKIIPLERLRSHHGNMRDGIVREIFFMRKIMRFWHPKCRIIRFLDHDECGLLRSDIAKPSTPERLCCLHFIHHSHESVPINRCGMCRQKITDHVETISNVISIETEYLPNGDLLNLLSRTRHKPLPETVICLMFIQILEAIEFLHESVGIAHRDLKPENIGFTRSLDLCIFDFGEAVDILETSILPLSSATSAYVTPEGKHAMQDATLVDMWCAGLILLYLIVPEKLANPSPAIDIVCTFSLSYDDFVNIPDERVISPKAYKLLKGLLTWETSRYDVSTAQDAAYAWAESLGIQSSIAIKEHIANVLGLVRLSRSSETSSSTASLSPSSPSIPMMPSEGSSATRIGVN